MEDFIGNAPSPVDGQNMNDQTQTTQQVFKTACGGTIQDPSSYPSAMFNGERVYFCTTACLKAFQRMPEEFMAGEVEHPLEEDEPPTS